MEIKWWDEWVERRWTWDEISRVIIVYTLDDGMIDWLSGDGDKMEIIWDDMIWRWIGDGDKDEMRFKCRWRMEKEEGGCKGIKQEKQWLEENSKYSNSIFYDNHYPGKANLNIEEGERILSEFDYNSCETRKSAQHAAHIWNININMKPDTDFRVQLCNHFSLIIIK